MKKITRRKFFAIKNGMMFVKDLDDETVKFFTKGYDVSETTLRRIKKSRNFDEYRELVAYDCRNNAKNREKIIKEKIRDEKDVEVTKLKLDKLALEYRLEIADELITKQLTVVKQLTDRIVKEYRKSNTIIAIAAIGIVLNLIALFAKVFGEYSAFYTVNADNLSYSFSVNDGNIYANATSGTWKVVGRS